MFRHLLLFAVFVIPCVAQDLRIISSVRGTVVAEESLAGNHLTVDLVESLNHRQLSRSYVGPDGSFEFHDVQPGVYTLELGASGNPIEQQSVSINGSSDRLEILLPTRDNKPVVGSGTVSVRQLQHPLSGKSKKIFDAAERAAAAGDYLKAAEILRGALHDASAEPYARMNIGIAFLRAGKVELAVPELQEAARLIPDDALVRTNLAYALLLAKRMDAAEAECRRALQLDRNNSKARWVMGSILLKEGSHEEEAVEDLRFASREIPKAKVILAQFYEQSGQKDAAARELRELLPQTSGAERATVEQWLSKLAPK